MREESKIYDAVRDRRLLDALQNTSAVLFDRHTPDEKLRLILQQVNSLGFDRIRFYLSSDEGKSLRAAAHVGMDADFEGRVLRPADGEALHAILQDPRPRLWRHDGGPLSPPGDPPDGESVAECAYVPLSKAGRLLGLVSVDNSVSRRPIDDDGLRHLSLFSPHVIAAAESHLLAELERRAQGLRSVMRLYSTLNSSHDVGEVFEAACQAAIQLTGADHGSLIIFEEGLSKGEVRAEYPNLRLSGSEVSLRDVPAVARLLDTAEPLVVGDVTAEESLGPIRDILLDRGVRSSIFIPVVGQRGPLGAFSVNTLHRPYSFTGDEVDVCKMLAAQVAVSIENARLHEEERRWTRQLEALRRTTLDITSKLHRKELLEAIIKQAVELLNGKSGGIYEYYPERGELTIAADFNRSENVGKTLKVGEGMAGRLVLPGAEPFLIVSEYDDWPGRAPIYKAGRAFGAVVEAPLKWREQAIGVLYVDDTAGRIFEPKDARLLSLFADQAAIALVNARLAESEEAKLRKIEILARAAREFLSHVTYEDLGARLELIAKYATEISDAEVCDIFRVDGEGLLRLEASHGHRGGGPGGPVRLRIHREPEGGLAGFIAGTGELFSAYGDELANHPAACGDSYDFVPSGECTALLAIPLKKNVGGVAEVVGLLRVINKRVKEGAPLPPRGFTEDDKWILKILAGAVVIAFDNTDVVEKLKGQRDDLREQKLHLTKIESRLALLLKAGALVAQADSLEEGLQNLSAMVVSLLSHTFCRIHLLDEGGTALVTNGAHPIGRQGAPLGWEPRLGARTELSEYRGLQEFLDAGEPKVIRWSDAEFRPYLQRFAERLALTEPVRAMLMIPLKIGDEVIGLLNVGESRSERSAFTEESVELATDLAAQISVLVRRLWHYERRRTLLVRLGNATRGIMGNYDREKIYQETVTLAVGMVGYEAGALFRRQSQNQGFELCAEYQLGKEVGLKAPLGEGLLARVARTGESRMVQRYSESGEYDGVLGDCDFKTVIAVPLMRAGEVGAVLVVGERMGRRISSEAELEVLERFAEQASIALQTSMLVSREKLAFRHLEVLHQISDYVMSAQDVGMVFDAVLTGITANYGLKFNRAAIFLLDELEETLVGKKGIGYLDRADAMRDWEGNLAHGPSDFNAYVNSLGAGGAPPETPVNAAVSAMRLPVGEGADDLFTRTVMRNEWVGVTSEFHKLPEPFREALKPTSPMLIIPLAARGRPIGLIAADNEFTRAPIKDDDMEAAMTFANTAAMAVENIRLFRRIQEGRHKLRMLFTASTALSTSREPRQVLAEIVEQTRLAARAKSVEIVLNEQAGKSQKFAEWGAGELGRACLPFSVDAAGHATQLTRPGASDLPAGGGDGACQSSEWADVMRCQQLCLPLSLHGKCFGWMSINYERPRTFMALEIDALQLYVNHAAVAYDSARRMEMLTHMRFAAEALAGAADANGVLRQIARSARAALQADSAAIWVYDVTRNAFVPDGWVASHISGELRREFWKAKPRADGTAYTVMARGWVAVEDVSDEGSYPFLGATTRRLLDRIGVQSFIGVSLTVGDEPLGVLYVNFGAPRQFTTEDEQTARTFANHAALALKKARLLEQVTKAKKAAEAVARVMVLGKREDTLQSIAEEMQLALDCDIVMLFEYEMESKTLVHPPTMVGLDEEGQRKAMLGGVVDPKSIVYWILEKDSPYIVESVEHDPMFRHKRFAMEERIKSCVGIPIRMQEKKLGVMFVNYKTPRRFTPDELSVMMLFSNQAAVAIQNAQLFEARNLSLRQQGELLKFSEELLGVVSLQDTMDRAVKITADILDVDCCAIVLPDEGGDLVISAAYGWPLEFVGKEKLKGGKGSQSGLTIKSRAPVMVEDYRLEHRFEVPDFVRKYGIRSGLSAPMFVGGEPDEQQLIGIMLVHSKSPRSFSDEDQTLLKLIANDTAVAIQRTRQYEELRMTRWRIGARTALVWMGMVNNYYQHTIVGHGNTINSRLELIRAEERKRGPHEKVPAWVEKHLDEIADNVKKIIERPITPPLSSEEGLADLHLNDLVSERLSQLWARNPYRSVRLHVDLEQASGLIVHISPEWLRRALDILIDNAVGEMQHVSPERRELKVGAHPSGEHVAIYVTDRGRGFPQEVADKIFKGRIEKQADAKGLGMGLLMAQAIIETYGGSLDIMETSPGGTTMCIWLPLASRSVAKGKGGADNASHRNE
jgi:GAF domain-containing protein